jgi:hypothetical protein
MPTQRKVVLVSPSTKEHIPLEFLADAEIILQADYPDGVINIMEREDYDWTLHMEEHGPTAEIQRWIDFGESLRRRDD